MIITFPNNISVEGTEQEVYSLLQQVNNMPGKSVQVKAARSQSMPLINNKSTCNHKLSGRKGSICIKYYLQGHTAKELAEAYGVSYGAMRIMLQVQGVAKGYIKSRGHWSSRNKQLWIKQR